MALGDVVKKARKRRTKEEIIDRYVGEVLSVAAYGGEPPREHMEQVWEATQQDLADVQETWRLEDEERAMFMPRTRVIGPELSEGARSLKRAFDDVLYKHHPDGLPSWADDYGDEL